MVRKIAIVVASGTGSRMGGEIPKQFMLLDGKPVLVHTLEKFLALGDCEIVLALSEAGWEYWRPLARQYFPEVAMAGVIGGDTRFHSVKNALDSLADVEEAVVAIHDGVRPFVSVEVLQNSFVAAEKEGSAVACVNSKDSVRLADGAGNRAVERDRVKLVQTPQTFRLSVLRKAFELPYSESFTDDAAVVERSGHPIHLIEGSYSNIKITTPEDMALGILLAKGRK